MRSMIVRQSRVGGRAYVISALNGAPAADLNNDGEVDDPGKRYEELGNQGIPPSPQIIIPPTEDDDESCDPATENCDDAPKDCPDIKYAVLIGTSIINGNSINACGVEKRQWRELDSMEQADERIQKFSGGNP